MEEKYDLSINESMNHEGVCRTAPAIPGQVKILNTGDTEFFDVSGGYLFTIELKCFPYFLSYICYLKQRFCWSF